MRIGSLFSGYGGLEQGVQAVLGGILGWVTGVPGLTRNEMLKALGNGVVPQQAEAALRILLNRARAAA